MANPKLSASLYSYLGLATVLAFFILMAVGGVVNFWGGYGALRFGWFIYFLGTFATVLGMLTKEDHVAIGGILGLNVLVILDVGLNVGVLVHW